MSNILNKPFYIPRNLKFEIKPYLNGYILWFSSFLYTFKKSTFLIFGLNLRHQNAQIITYINTDYLHFYQLQPQYLKKWKKKSLNTFYIENNQNFISANTGYKKLLTIRGIGYKFSLKNNLLFVESGYSHVLFFNWKSSFQAQFSRKLKSMSLKHRNLKYLMDYLSIIKKNRPVNLYTKKGIRYSKESLKYKEGKRKKSF